LAVRVRPTTSSFAYNAFHEVFGGIEKCSLGLRLFSAARRAALGDRKALFDLPLEVRRLIPSGSIES
jgi:hypothetical protein